ncbi:MAG: hypothetical protein AABZ31_10150 [Bdellovibrionota bacterium]|mgnify:CR=1 FL=1
MKLLISTLLLLPTLAFADVTTVRLNFSNKSVQKESTLCLYTAEIYLGNENTIKPFQLMSRQDDGSYALMMKPLNIHLAKNGQFFIKTATAKSVKAGQECPAHAEISLIK